MGFPRICSGLASSGGEGRVEQLGDAEVEQLRLSRLGDQDVARLDIAVDDKVLVRKMDGKANLLEDLYPLGDRQPVTVAIEVDRFSFDVLHDEVRHPRRPARIEEPGDRRVVQAGKDLAFGLETPDHFRCQELRADQLDGYLLLQLAVVSQAEEDLAHAAFPDPAHQPVGAYALRSVRQPSPVSRYCNPRFKLRVRCQQSFDFAADLDRFAAGVVEKVSALERRELHSPIEEINDTFGVVRSHVGQDR
jgi:hypothetical protein